MGRRKMMSRMRIPYASCIRLPILVVTAIFLISADAGADAADGTDNASFNNGAGAAPPNQDSDPVPGLSMQTPTYSGAGCPQGSVSAALSPDSRELSILFDNYIVRAGGASARTAV